MNSSISFLARLRTDRQWSVIGVMQQLATQVGNQRTVAYNVATSSSARGGGIANVRADLPSRCRPELEPTIIESIVIEATVCDRKWAIEFSHQPPSLSMSDTPFNKDFTMCIDKLYYISITSSLLGI